jgi:hypothetical protein
MRFYNRNKISPAFIGPIPGATGSLHLPHLGRQSRRGISLLPSVARTSTNPYAERKPSISLYVKQANNVNKCQQEVKEMIPQHRPGAQILA